MAVVVNDGDAFDDAFHVKATANTGKFRHAFANQFGRHVEIERNCSRRSGIADVVDAWRMRQLEDAEVIAFVGEAEFAAEPFEFYIAYDQVSLRRRAVGNDGPLHAGDDRLNVGLVEAKDRGTIERNAVYEFDERALDVFERRVLIEMLAVDGGD